MSSFSAIVAGVFHEATSGCHVSQGLCGKEQLPSSEMMPSNINLLPVFNVKMK
jgi:hypothetical protein